MALKGGCLCGGVRYEIEAEPMTSRVCWCRTCQALGAGGGTVNVCFPSGAIRIQGQLRDFVSSSAREPWTTRRSPGRRRPSGFRKRLRGPALIRDCRGSRVSRRQRLDFPGHRRARPFASARRTAPRRAPRAGLPACRSRCRGASGRSVQCRSGSRAPCLEMHTC